MDGVLIKCLQVKKKREENKTNDCTIQLLVNYPFPKRKKEENKQQFIF